MPAKILEMLAPPETDYVDRRFKGTKEEYFARLAASSTLYIGNLSFYTTEDQVYALFSRAGHVKRVVMGLDKQRRTPCGFCFVVYDKREDALAAVRYLNGTSLDERPIRVDIDYGFEEGRQYGRGRSGGQVRDEFRTDYDSARGGFGKQLVKQIAAQGLAVKPTPAGGVAFVPLQPPARGGDGGGEGAAAAADGEGGGGEPSAKRRRVGSGEEAGGGDGEQQQAEGGDGEQGAGQEGEGEEEAAPMQDGGGGGGDE